ncbi:MAG TPA: glycine C-acetyltransferase [Patescibacteria group bacterium]|nr:glycine C-acetyltransferase [Patescibacteria group bacterium]
MATHKFFEEKVEELKNKGLFNNIKTVESGQGAYLTINGKKMLNFCSNNYLGLASHERVKKAAKEAIEKMGVGTASVRTLSGTNSLHIELEEKLAKFKHAEAALVLQGGFMANMAAIQTIIGKEDIVISDELNHASIIDAIRLSQVKTKLIYKHKDMKELEQRLIEASKIAKTSKSNGEHPLILIVTDGVFSMDGDLAPLPEIIKLAKRYGALTMVDDAHGEGVLGDYGRGVADHFKVCGEIDIEVGTLSKAFGVVGGFITGKKALIDFYRQKARQFLFSNGLSIPDTAALIETVNILEESDELVKKLWENADYLKKNFVKLGFNTGKSESPITPVILGDENLAKDFSAKLFENGVFATPIKFPMVPMGTARIRVMPSAAHTKADLTIGIKAFEKAGKELEVL